MDIKKGDIVVVLGSRDNPQLGTYLTGPYPATVKRVGEKTGSFSIKYLHEIDNFRPTRFMSDGYTRFCTNCVYGSMSYRVYTKPDAIEKLTTELYRYPEKSIKFQDLLKGIDSIKSL